MHQPFGFKPRQFLGMGVVEREQSFSQRLARRYFGRSNIPQS